MQESCWSKDQQRHRSSPNKTRNGKQHTPQRKRENMVGAVVWREKDF
jgi:hypothetical protein